MSSPNARRRAVFLDRDGTLCEEMGYLNHISRLQIYPFAAAAVRRLNDAGWPVIVVTNQSGVARKIYPESLIAEVHARITADFAAQGARVDAFYYCPHQKSDRCACRKPMPGLIVRAAMDLGLEPQGSWMVGDGGPGGVSMRLRKELVDIQRGAAADRHGWLYLARVSSN